MTKFVLTIDQSTSATTALLFDTTGNLINQVSVNHQQYYPQPGWVEHDAEEIYRNTLAVIQQLLDKYPAQAKDLLCLSITNQRETIVLFDEVTGQPLHPAIVWQCRRGEAICQNLIDEGYSDHVKQLTGLPIDTYFSASKIKWLMDTQPELKTRLQEGTVLIGTIETYLIYRLTNGAVYATDHTNACRTLLYDIHNLSWSQDLCNLFGVPHQALATIQESSAAFGETTCNYILDQPIPICGVMGDSQAALFAQRCFHRGGAKVTFGTGSSVLLNIGDEPLRSDNGIVTTVAWVYNGKPTYAFEGIINFTGATIAWLRDQLQLIDDVAQTEALANSIPDNGGVFLVPAFVGLSAPYWRADVQGAIVGLTPASTKAHIVRAALESIAYQVRDVLGLMADDADTSLSYVQADGGAVRNQFLMQFTADMLGFEVRSSQLPELSALGAVFSGLLGMNTLQSLDDLVKTEQAFALHQPTMAKATVEQHYARWKVAVQRVL